MKLKIDIEGKEAIAYLDYVRDKCNKDINISKIVNFEYIKADVGYELNFSTNFPKALFIQLSLLFISGSIITYMLWEITTPIFIAIFISLFLMIPIFIQTKYVMKIIITNGLRKFNYTGDIKWL